MADYIEALYQRKKQVDPLGGAIIGAAQVAGGVGALSTQMQEQQRQMEAKARELARQRLGDMQTVAQNYATAGNKQALVGLAPKIVQAQNEALGLKGDDAFKGPKFIGTYGPERTVTGGAAPGLSDDMPGYQGVRPIATVRDYDANTPDVSNPANQEAAMRTIGLPAGKWESVPASGAVYRQTPGGSIETKILPTPIADQRANERERALDLREKQVNDAIRLHGLTTDLQRERLEIARAKAEVYGAPTQADLLKLGLSRDAKKAEYAQRERNAYQSSHTKFVKNEDDEMVPVGPTEAQLNKVTADAEARWDRINSGSGLLRGVKAANGLPIPPKSYEDTKVFDRVERIAQQVEKAFPGGYVSSRARSDARDLDAKASAGIAGGRNNHGERNVLDYVPPAGQREAAMEFFRARGGVPEWHGTHIHVKFPDIQSAAPKVELSPELADFYQRYNIQPGAGSYA